MHWFRKTLVVIPGLLLAAAMAVGQNSKAPAPAAKTQASSAPEDSSTTSKLMFGSASNLETVNGADVQVGSLTPAEKFELVRNYFSPSIFTASAIGAGIQQAADSRHGYGQGTEGYGKRYGALFADGFTSKLFVTGTFPSLLHQDPRYFRKGEGGFAARTFYAVSRVLVTRTDSGRHTLNSSEILGNLASSGVSNLYYPDDERSWQDVFSRAGTRIGVHALRFTLKEFAPDIIRKLKHKGRLEDAPASAEIPDKN